MNGRIPSLSTETLSKVFSPENLKKNILYVDDEDWRFLNELLDTEDIYIKYWPNSPRLEQNDRGGCIDLYNYEDVSLKAGEWYLMPLGVAMAIPEEYDAILLPRSSTFLRYGVIMGNSVGYFDCMYRGPDDEWKAPMYATRDIVIPKGTRLFQFRLIKKQPKINFIENDLETEKNRGGFGSSGK